jgi:hypothetical protein
MEQEGSSSFWGTPRVPREPDLRGPFFFFGLVWFGFLRQGTCSVDQSGLELRDLSASASQVLGLKMYATNTDHSTSESLKSHGSVAGQLRKYEC